MQKNNILTLIATIVFPLVAICQAPPQGVNYQAVAVDANGKEIVGVDAKGQVIPNREISVRFSILNSTNQALYVEQHTTNTDANGLFNLVIGFGNPSGGLLSEFSDIDWGAGTHFLRVEMDINGGNDFVNMGTQQLLSVPYALYAETAGNAGSTGEAITWLGTLSSDPTNPNLNDAYYNSVDGISYIWNGNSWNIMAQDGQNGQNGQDGQDGAQGPQGIPGVNGISINWLGTLTSNPSSPNLNDAYYNSVDRVSYIWNGSSWNIIARDGQNGSGGSGSSIVWLGTLTNFPPNPNTNDAFYHSTNGISYIYDGSIWNILAQDGATGSQGPQGLQGNVGPAGANGVGIVSTINNGNGTYTFNYSDGSSFTTSNLTGPQGPQGIQGIQGVQGIPGTTGPAGANGISITWLGTFASAPGSPSLNQAYYNSTDGRSYIWNGSAWNIMAQDGAAGGGGGNTLNQAYNQGGAGAGRVITANAGSVEINGTTATTNALIVTSTVNNSAAIRAVSANNGVAINALNTSASNSFSTIQATTNSSNNQVSAIIGNNEGAGYGVSGQISASATGSSAIFGNNLRTNGGSGVRGVGVNGLVGESTNGAGFGSYGLNLSPTGLAVGSYGRGWISVYGEVATEPDGWAGFFNYDINVVGGIYVNNVQVASDARLKSNVQPINGALGKLSLINGKFYSIHNKRSSVLEEESEKKPSAETISSQEYGVIAQELEEIFPEMVKERAIYSTMGDETLYKTVDYIQLIPILIEAIKELNAELQELKESLR
jgi:hypothetical protein